MRIAVLSGKGGTGKTFVAVNLAYICDNSLYIDCDVEEPNGWIFLKPHETKESYVHAMIPEFNAEKCIGCRKCVDFCKFNALAYTSDKLLIFPEICHGCGGCIMLCPASALSEEQREIGKIVSGTADKVEIKTGFLNIGEASGVFIIRELISNLPSNKNIIIDCPPGSSCLVMESIKDSDYCLMVAEPTSFGLHNLKMIYKLVKLFSKKHGIVINKDMNLDTETEKFCQQNNIPIISRISYDNELAIINSKGEIATALNQNYRDIFEDILNKVTRCE